MRGRREAGERERGREEGKSTTGGKSLLVVDAALFWRPKLQIWILRVPAALAETRRSEGVPCARGLSLLYTAVHSCYIQLIEKGHILYQNGGPTLSLSLSPCCTLLLYTSAIEMASSLSEWKPRSTVYRCYIQIT